MDVRLPYLTIAVAAGLQRQIRTCSGVNRGGSGCYVREVGITSAFPDSSLLSRVAHGDQDALRVLYERHAGAMLRLIRRLTADRAVAEEILQESWLAAWQSAGSFRGESGVLAWLLGVARRQAHNRLRKRALPTVELDETVEPAMDGPDVEDQVLAGMEFDQVVAAVRELPTQLREVLDLVLLERLSYADIAAILDIPVGTVKSRMAQVKRRVSHGTRWASNESRCVGREAAAGASADAPPGAGRSR